MKIKDAVVENCTECGRYKREISPEQHGCDQCREPIVPYGNDERLDVIVFHKDDNDTKSFFFCSWNCVFTFVRKIKTDYFFTLPYVSAENKIIGRRAKDFLSALKEARK